MMLMTECLKCYVGTTKTSWLGITSGNLEEKECFNKEVDDYLYNGGFACVKNSGCKYRRNYNKNRGSYSLFHIILVKFTK